MESDANIAHLSLHYELGPWEGYTLDGVYKRITGVVCTPTGLHKMADRTEALARSRYECGNKWIREVICLKTTFRNNRTERY